MAFLLRKFYTNFGGENLRSPELTREQSIATETRNCILADNLSLRKRTGTEITTISRGGAGSTTFNQVDIASGITARSRVVVDDNLHIEQVNSLDIEYSGAGSAGVAFSLSPVTSTFTCKFYINGLLVNTIDVGTGKGLSEPSVVDLIASINAIPDFSATTTGPGLSRAAFIASSLFVELPGSLSYREYEAVPTPTGITNTFAGHWSTRNDEGFELAQFAQTNDVLYITNGIDGLHKYDGERVYKAGLPTPSAITAIPQAGTLSGNYAYRVFYRHIDATENIVNSGLSPDLEVTLTSENNVLTIPTIQEGSGFDTDSPNLEIVVLRTVSGGALFYEIDSFPNMPTATTINYTDIVTDEEAVLLTQFTEPVIRIGLPPVARYIDVWRNQIILTGDSTQVNRVFFSDLEFIEGFSLLNTFETSSRLGGANSGVRSLDNYLYVFKANSVSTVTGDLNSAQFQIDTLSDEGVGCLSASSLEEVGGQIWFLSRKGIYSVSQGSITERSAALKPLFDNRTYTAIRCTSVNWIEERVALFSLNTFTDVGGELICDKDITRVLCFDLETGAWTTWTNIDMSAGASLDLDRLWVSGSITNSNDIPLRANAEFLMLGSNEDYADNEEAIDFSYATHWETLGEAAVPKKFHRILIYSIDDVTERFTTEPFTLTVETNRDYLDAITSTWDLDFGGGALGWGDFPWGTTPFGELNLNARKTRLAARKSRALRVIFRNSILHENVLISGYELEVYAPFTQSIKDNI